METFTKYQLTSAYRNLPINVFISPGNKDTTTALVLHPGAFEPAWGDSHRYKQILLWLQRKLSFKPHIVTYQTSRIQKPPPRLPIDKNYWKEMEKYWQEIFNGKTFDQELDDVRKIFNFLLSRKIKEIHSLGFSFGGTLAMILTSEFPQVTKVCTLGSAISTKRDYLPVLTGYPDKPWLLKRISRFPHYINLYQGFEDTVVPFHDVEEIFCAVQKAKRVSVHRISKADHMFSGKNKYGLSSANTLLPEIKAFFELNINE
ncbi:MAG: dienelactone hydrolase family protein [Patescibacteria group bacterium]